MASLSIGQIRQLIWAIRPNRVAKGHLSPPRTRTRTTSALAVAITLLASLAIPVVGLATSLQRPSADAKILVKWPTDTVTFHLHPACTWGPKPEPCLAHVRKAVEAWAAPSCANLNVTVGAPSSVIPQISGDASLNGLNEIAWLKGGAWTAGKFVYGMALFRYMEKGEKAGYIQEADIAMNGANATWSLTGEPNTGDVWSVVAHEVGHSLGLMHNLYPSKDNWPTMASQGRPNLEARTLEKDDLNGLCVLYPKAKGLPCKTAQDCPYLLDSLPGKGDSYVGRLACQGGYCDPSTSVTVTNGKAIDEPCQTTDNCKPPATCLPTSGSQSLCSLDCDLVSALRQCSKGYLCSFYSGDPNTGLCIDRPGYTPAADNTGKTCATSNQCSGGLCVKVGGQATCRRPCTTKQPCKTGEKCSFLKDTYFGVCVSQGETSAPIRLKSPLNAVCSASSQCESELCVNAGGGGVCTQSCKTESCAQGWLCIDLQQDQNGCLKPGPKPLGAKCAQPIECASGMCAYQLGDAYPATCTSACQTGGATCPDGFMCAQNTVGTMGCFTKPDPNENKPATKPGGAPCKSSDECLSAMCVSGKCGQNCSIFSPQKCAKPASNPPLGCARLAVDNPNGFCTTTGSVPLDAKCSADADCASLFCHSNRCGSPCNRLTGAGCASGASCALVEGMVGVCLRPLVQDKDAEASSDASSAASSQTPKGGLCSAAPTGTADAMVLLLLAVFMVFVVRRRGMAG